MYAPSGMVVKLSNSFVEIRCRGTINPFDTVDLVANAPLLYGAFKTRTRTERFMLYRFLIQLVSNYCTECPKSRVSIKMKRMEKKLKREKKLLLYGKFKGWKNSKGRRSWSFMENSKDGKTQKGKNRSCEIRKILLMINTNMLYRVVIKFKFPLPTSQFFFFF